MLLKQFCKWWILSQFVLIIFFRVATYAIFFKFLPFNELKNFQHKFCLKMPHFKHFYHRNICIFFFSQLAPTFDDFQFVLIIFSWLYKLLCFFQLVHVDVIFKLNKYEILLQHSVCVGKCLIMYSVCRVFRFCYLFSNA